MLDPPFKATQMHPNVWNVVEDDRFSEKPIMYIIFAKEFIVLIDTGVNTASYLDYLLTSEEQLIEFQNYQLLLRLVNEEQLSLMMRTES